MLVYVVRYRFFFFSGSHLFIWFTLYANTAGQGLRTVEGEIVVIYLEHYARYFI